MPTYVNENVVMSKSGIELHREGKPPILLAAPISVMAQTYDSNFEKDFGILLRWTNRAKVSHQKVFRVKDIYIDGGRSLIQHLADTGLFIHHKQGYWKYIIDFILSEDIEKTVVTVEQTGWYFDQFVTPSWTAGFDIFAEQEVIFHSDTAEKFKAKGTFVKWRDTVARICEYNSLMMLAVCTSFAAPLLSKLGWDSFIIHFVGSSKNGKSTLLKLASSVISDHKYCDSWSSTDNGLEARAKSRNNLVFCLDELQQCDPMVIEQSVYQIANGVTKLRATKTANLQEQGHWNVIGLSTGEVSLAQMLGQVNRKVQAGQLMRFFEIPLFQSYGAFDYLHNCSSSKEFAELISKTTSDEYGTALQPFLTQISCSKHFESIIRKEIENISDFWLLAYDINASNQIKFAADRFAFIAAVGEMAVSMDVLPWEVGSVKSEIGKVFEAWVSNQHDDCDYEEQNVRIRLSRILSKWVYSLKQPNQLSKIGWWQYEGDNLCWFITREAFKSGLELETNPQIIQATQIMRRRNWLKTNEPARGTFKSSISGKAQRDFKIYPQKIAESLGLTINYSHFIKEDVA